MAAAVEREHQWSAAPVLPKGTDLGVHPPEHLIDGEDVATDAPAGAPGRLRDRPVHRDASRGTRSHRCGPQIDICKQLRNHAAWLEGELGLATEQFRGRREHLNLRDVYRPRAHHSRDRVLGREEVEGTPPSQAERTVQTHNARQSLSRKQFIGAEAAGYVIYHAIIAAWLVIRRSWRRPSRLTCQPQPAPRSLHPLAWCAAAYWAEKLPLTCRPASDSAHAHRRVHAFAAFT